MTAKDVYMIAKLMELQIQCTALHCRQCRNMVNCKMHVLAQDMILRGEY